jgi:hypothetical protein
MLSDVQLSWTNRVKYLGCHFISRTCAVDVKEAVGKFYGSVNNILSVIGKNRNEMMAVHLMKTYCLPTLVYGCEVWSSNMSDMHTVKAAWNNAFRKIFNACWRESVNPILFYSHNMALNYIADMRKITFYKRLLRCDSLVIAMLLRLSNCNINALCAKYGIVLHCNSVAVIKDRIWKSFPDSIVLY